MPPMISQSNDPTYDRLLGNGLMWPSFMSILSKRAGSVLCSRVETKGINGNCPDVVWTEICARSMEHKIIATTVTDKLIIPSFFAYPRWTYLIL